jgi:hypothetical protein
LELSDSADYDEVEKVGEQLKSFRIPEEEKDRVERIVDAISMLDFDDLETLIKE